jgi:hypothetical protein
MLLIRMPELDGLEVLRRIRAVSGGVNGGGEGGVFERRFHKERM